MLSPHLMLESADTNRKVRAAKDKLEPLCLMRTKEGGPKNVGYQCCGLSVLQERLVHSSQLVREVRAGQEVRKDQISIQERGPSASTDTASLLPALAASR